MGAINYGSLASVSILVPYTKSINSTNEKKQTALHCAAAYPAPYKTIKLLLDSGADGTMKDADGRTPYDLYLSYNPDKYNSKIARLLREAGGEPY